MAISNLHVICGNCGTSSRDGKFTMKIDPHGIDVGLGSFEPEVYLTCQNCGTLHALSDNAELTKGDDLPEIAPAAEPTPEEAIMIEAFRREFIKIDLRGEDELSDPVLHGLVTKGILNYEYDGLDEMGVFALTIKGMKAAERINDQWKQWRPKN
jgi:hypothetical protein